MMTNKMMNDMDLELINGGREIEAGYEALNVEEEKEVSFFEFIKNAIFGNRAFRLPGGVNIMRVPGVNIMRVPGVNIMRVPGGVNIMR